MTEMDSHEAREYYGFEPETIGRNHEEWWIVAGKTTYLRLIGGKNGDLCVRARDGNTPHKIALNQKNFRSMYRKKMSPEIVYYFFEPL